MRRPSRASPHSPRPVSQYGGDRLGVGDLAGSDQRGNLIRGDDHDREVLVTLQRGIARLQVAGAVDDQFLIAPAGGDEEARKFFDIVGYKAGLFLELADGALARAFV